MEKDTKGKECLPFNVKFKGNFIIDEEKKFKSKKRKIIEEIIEEKDDE